MANFYCEYCGAKASSVQALVSGYCIRFPLGPNKGKHKVYEGGEKSKYTCKYCGTQNTSIQSLVAGYCIRHPEGPNKGKHAPML